VRAVGRATGWKAGKCRHVQMSELFSIEICDQAVMDFLAAQRWGSFHTAEQSLELVFLFHFLLWMVIHFGFVYFVILICYAYFILRFVG
jgi:hypothetical protein